MPNLQNIISKYSKGNFPTYEFPEHDRSFTKLKDLELDKKYTIQALFINTKGKFGDQGVIYTNEFIINLPNHLLDLIKDLRSDEEVTEAINNRQLAFTVYSYATDTGRSGYSINITTSNAPSDNTKGRAFNNEDSNI